MAHRRVASVPPEHSLPSDKQTTQLNPVVSSVAKFLLKENKKTIFSVGKTNKQKTKSNNKKKKNGENSENRRGGKGKDGGEEI